MIKVVEIFYFSPVVPQGGREGSDEGMEGREGEKEAMKGEGRNSITIFFHLLGV